MNHEVARARAMLARALENFERYGPGTNGRRDAVHRDIPNAVEALVEAKMAAMRQAALHAAAKSSDEEAV